MGLPRWLSGKGSACQYRRCRFDPWVGKIPWSRKWQHTPLKLKKKEKEKILRVRVTHIVDCYRLFIVIALYEYVAIHTSIL